MHSGGNMRKSIIFFLIFCIALISVNAIKVNYNLYEGTVYSNGSYTKTTNPLNNVNVIGFTCLDKNCSAIGNRIFNSQVLNSDINPFITLHYPEILLSQYGYAIYYFKDGYIPWESNPNWFGPDTGPTRGPFDVYLTKKDSCISFITNFSVINLDKPYLPLIVSATTGIDATTISAIKNAGPLGAIPNEIANNYKLKQMLRLVIYDKNNQIVSDKIEQFLIGFGESKELIFEYTPSQPGKYTILLQSKVLDSKCLISQDITASKIVNVLGQEPRNMCYTLINNVNLNAFTFKSGDTINITGKKISNFAK